MANILVVDDLQVKNSALLPANTNIPTNSVGDSQIDPTDPITPDNLYHRHQQHFAQDRTTTAVAQRRVIHVAKNDGTLSAVVAGLAIANIGDATTTFNLYKNGTTCLSGTIVLTSSQAAYVTLSGSPTSSGIYTAGDVFEAAIDSVAVTSGTKGLGAFLRATFNEKPV